MNYRSLSALTLAAALASSAFAQEASPPQPSTPANDPTQPAALPVNTPTPPAGDSKLDEKLTPKSEPLIPFFSGWKGGVEIGLNGSEGNSQSFNVHAGATAERKTDFYDTKASMTYLRASADNKVTKNRFEVDAQNDWIFAKGSPWRYFVKGTGEYDDFQDWQERVTLSTGIGYAFIENEKTTLIGRAGVGIRDDFGGSDNRIHPEGLLGVDWSQKISERQKLTVTAEYFQDFLDLAQYRARLKAGWELLVDPETKLSIKIGLEDRFDSDPGPGKKHNDLDYFALLVWSF